MALAFNHNLVILPADIKTINDEGWMVFICYLNRDHHIWIEIKEREWVRTLDQPYHTY